MWRCVGGELGRRLDPWLRGAFLPTRRKAIRTRVRTGPLARGCERRIALSCSASTKTKGLGSNQTSSLRREIAIRRSATELWGFSRGPDEQPPPRGAASRGIRSRPPPTARNEGVFSALSPQHSGAHSLSQQRRSAILRGCTAWSMVAEAHFCSAFSTSRLLASCGLAAFKYRRA